MKQYNKIEASVLTIGTSVICASTVDINATPVNGTKDGVIEAGARGNNGIDSNVIVDWD